MKTDIIHIKKTQEKSVLLLEGIFKLQKSIARDQTLILVKMRKLSALNIGGLQDELAENNITSYKEGKCSICGMNISGDFEYMRSSVDENKCSGCDSQRKEV